MTRIVHNSVETVNAAATAIVTAENRVQPSTVQKKKWGSWWSLYWCFGAYKHTKQIGHAVFIPDPTPQPSTGSITQNPNRSATTIFPFIAPPSSPASFLPSDPPSATHSPAALLSLASLSVQAGGTHPNFTIGPYAHETQLVSPPVFSTFTTEPSTAAFTPPPEPVQMTTPSSPDVPFAELLSSSLAKNRINRGPHYQIIGYEQYSNYKWGSRVGSGSLTPNGGVPRLGSGALTPNGGENQNFDPQLGKGDGVVDHRVSFELNGEDIPTCIVTAPEITSRNLRDELNVIVGRALENQKNRTVSFGSSKDFNFNNAKGDEVLEKSAIDCEWWTNEKVVRKELEPQNNHNWTFFPMLQSGVS